MKRVFHSKRWVVSNRTRSHAILVWWVGDGGVGWSESSCNFGHVAFQLASFASFIISLPPLLENLFQAKSDCPSEILSTMTFSQFMFPNTVCSCKKSEWYGTEASNLTWTCQTKAQQNDTELNMQMVDYASTLMNLLLFIPACPISRFSLRLHTVTAFNCFDRLRQGLGLGLMPSATSQWHPFLFLVPAVQSKRRKFPHVPSWFNTFQQGRSCTVLLSFLNVSVWSNPQSFSKSAFASLILLHWSKLTRVVSLRVIWWCVHSANIAVWINSWSKVDCTFGEPCCVLHTG